MDAEVSYIAKRGNDTYSYRIVGDILHCEWSRPLDSSYEKYPLSMLSNEFSIWNGRTNTVTRKIQRGGFFLLGAVILYFSEFHASFPYAAIVLLILGIGHLYNDIHWVAPATWTVVNNKDGVATASILHSNEGSNNRDEFEEKLAAAIVRSNKRENEA